MNEQLLDMAALRVDGDTQPRAAIDPSVVAEYSEALEAGAEFPPVEVVCDGATYWLVDGFHRFYAHRRLKRTQIRALVTTGELQDARWKSLGANKTHGLRRTNADKAKAVRKALKLHPEFSDRAIAEHVGVNHGTIARYREMMERQRSGGEIRHLPSTQAPANNCAPQKRIGSDGKRYPSPRRARRRRGGGRPPRVARAGVITIDLPTREAATAVGVLIQTFNESYLRALVVLLAKHLKMKADI